jgi:hypothetical protein
MNDVEETSCKPYTDDDSNDKESPSGTTLTKACPECGQQAAELYYSDYYKQGLCQYCWDRSI